MAPAPYRLEMKRTARKQFDALPARERERIGPKVLALADNPRPSGCLKMVGTANKYRIRVGEYRVVYEIHDALLLVLVLRVGPRGSSYRP